MEMTANERDAGQPRGPGGFGASQPQPILVSSSVHIPGVTSTHSGSSGSVGTPIFAQVASRVPSSPLYAAGYPGAPYSPSLPFPTQGWAGSPSSGTLPPSPLSLNAAAFNHHHHHHSPVIAPGSPMLPGYSMSPVMQTPLGAIYASQAAQQQPQQAQHQGGGGAAGPGLGVPDPDNDPPYSRLFVVCSKSVNEDLLRKEFDEFPDLEYCRVMYDKATQQSKGIAYVKYSKTSSAAMALEAVHGKSVGEDSTPLKVMIADAKGTVSSRRRDTSPRDAQDTPPRSRLFVVCPKDMQQERLEVFFSPMQGYEWCKVIKERGSAYSKGIAYVKFNTAVNAALAMEQLQQHSQIDGHRVKVLIANPRTRPSPDFPSSTGYPPAHMYPLTPHSPMMTNIHAAYPPMTEYQLPSSQVSISHPPQLASPSAVSLASSSSASVRSAVTPTAAATAAASASAAKSAAAAAASASAANAPAATPTPSTDAKAPGSDSAGTADQQQVKAAGGGADGGDGDDAVNGTAAADASGGLSPDAADDDVTKDVTAGVTAGVNAGVVSKPSAPAGDGEVPTAAAASSTAVSAAAETSSMPTATSAEAAVPATTTATTTAPASASATTATASATPATSAATTATTAQGTSAGRRSSSGVDERRLFVLCRGATEPELYQVFSKFPGFENVELKRHHGSGESRGFAFASFSTAETASAARTSLDSHLMPDGTRLKVLVSENPASGPSSSSSTASLAAAAPANAHQRALRPGFAAAGLTYPSHALGRMAAQHHAGLPPPPQQQQQQHPVSPGAGAGAGTTAMAIPLHAQVPQGDQYMNSYMMGYRGGAGALSDAEASRLLVVPTAPISQQMIWDVCATQPGLQDVILGVMGTLSVASAIYQSPMAALSAQQALHGTTLGDGRTMIKVYHAGHRAASAQPYQWPMMMQMMPQDFAMSQHQQLQHRGMQQQQQQQQHTLQLHQMTQQQAGYPAQQHPVPGMYPPF